MDKEKYKNGDITWNTYSGKFKMFDKYGNEIQFPNSEDKKCMFQQNYNIYGIEDKPCCYLYHKYCSDVDNCYFKRCKKYEKIDEKQTAEYFELMNFVEKDLKPHTELYISALRKIKDLCNKGAGIYTNAKIVGIINEVLE